MSLRAIHDSAEQQLDEAALSQLNAQTSDLSRTATRAVADRNDDAILECQAQADWLVAEREFLSDQGETATAGIEDVEALSARIRSAVPEDAALVQFAQVADDIWLVVATCEGISAQRSALTSFELAMLTTAFRYECDGIYPTDALSALEEGLLTPIEAVLRDKSTVIFAPNVELYGIPFQAMTLGGEHLVETHMISYVASSRDLREGMQQPSKFPLTPSSSCLVLGVPTVSYSDVDELPGVNAEIESIRAFFDAPVVCVEPPAESGDLLKNSASPRVLHLACHGQPETDAILLSRFLMADRPVFAFELMMADLNMDVAVITACETAEASHQAGGHMQSLATAFLRAGVRTVIAAFWPVDDEASAEFMRVFYQELLQGNAAVVALRTAQRHLRAQSRFAHPYFWAPFAIFGVSQPGRSV
jgi:CHAT domain-containing protein